MGKNSSMASLMRKVLVQTKPLSGEYEKHLACCESLGLGAWEEKCATGQRAVGY